MDGVIPGHITHRRGCCALCMNNWDNLGFIRTDRAQVGLNFMVYGTMSQYFTREGEDSPSGWSKLAAGAIAGGFAQTCTYPLYVFPKYSTSIIVIRVNNPLATYYGGASK